jgi:predicted  nucleic acid-binding Zn-ribbon protein
VQEQLELLRDLQELDLDLIEKRKEKSKLEGEQSTITADLDKVQEMVDRLNGEIQVLEDQRKDLAQDLLVEEGNIQRAEERLPTIKTQKEYVALLKEVDAAKKMNKDIQDKIARLNEQMEALAADRDEKSNELTELNSSVEGRQAEINSDIAKCDKVLGEGDDKRDALLEQLPTSLRKRYEMLLDRRAGVAIVEARQGTCLGCNMNLPPQLFNTLFNAKEVMSCPHCNRMLFLNPSA